MHTFQRVGLKCVLQERKPPGQSGGAAVFPPTVQKSEDRETDFFFFLDEVNLSNLLKCAFNNKYKNLYLESFHILNNTVHFSRKKSLAKTRKLKNRTKENQILQKYAC